MVETRKDAIMQYIDNSIKRVPDFPKPGVLFYDISAMLADEYAWPLAISLMSNAMVEYKPELIVGVEARGFIFAAPLSINFGTGLALVRKRGKIPGETFKQEYSLEYGHKVLELSTLSIKKGQRVVIVDDLLATGGTAHATVDLIEKAGGTVAAVMFAMELKEFGARKKFKVPVYSLISY